MPLEPVLVVTTPATTHDLTVIDNVKAELGITDQSKDALFTRWVSVASRTIEVYCRRIFAQETVTETFYQPTSFQGLPLGVSITPPLVPMPLRFDRAPSLRLSRYPVTQIQSVTEDQTTLYPLITLTQAALTSIASDSGGTVTFGGGDPVAAGLQVGMTFNVVGSTGNEIDGMNFLITGFSGPTNEVVSVTPPPATTTASTLFTLETVPDYLIDEIDGLLYRLDCNGNLIKFSGSQIVVSYTGGYVVPTNTPLDLEQACIQLVTLRYFTAQRDPTLRSINIPGVQEETYWVGARGDDGAMPPEIAGLLEPYREIHV